MICGPKWNLISDMITFLKSRDVPWSRTISTFWICLQSLKIWGLLHWFGTNKALQGLTLIRDKGQRIVTILNANVGYKSGIVLNFKYIETAVQIQCSITENKITAQFQICEAMFTEIEL